MALSPFIFGCRGPCLEVQERQFFAKVQPFGFILFSRNLETPTQIRQLCADLRAAVGWHAPVMIDQEGGAGVASWRAALVRISAGAGSGRCAPSLNGCFGCAAG